MLWCCGPKGFDEALALLPVICVSLSSLDVGSRRCFADGGNCWEVVRREFFKNFPVEEVVHKSVGD